MSDQKPSDLPPDIFAAASSLNTRIDALGGRQREFVYAVGQGITNKQIADQANTSEQTVKNGLYTAFKTLGVSDRFLLLAQMKAAGLTNPESGAETFSFEDPSYHLSERELSVARLMAMGKKDKEISQELEIENITNIISSLYATLRIYSREELILGARLPSRKPIAQQEEKTSVKDSSSPTDPATASKAKQISLPPGFERVLELLPRIAEGQTIEHILQGQENKRTLIMPYLRNLELIAKEHGYDGLAPFAQDYVNQNIQITLHRPAQKANGPKTSFESFRDAVDGFMGLGNSKW